MADKEHLKILKQGVDEWNKWRMKNKDVKPNLRDADLNKAELIGANFNRANLNRAILFGANLTRTDLTRADLTRADLTRADLTRADLSGAVLLGTDLSRANLSDANLKESMLYFTILGNTNLKNARNLDSCRHRSPSIIDQMTLVKSGKLPEVFLKGCGLSDEFIQQIPFLFWNKAAFDFYTCFISYSSKDNNFANQLHADLQDNGVRCWFAPEDMKIGDRIRPTIDKSIRIYDKLLLVISENSINSTWVEKEVETAFEKETQNKHTVLFPIRLDDGIMDTNTAWAADIRRTRHIGNFTNWKDHDAYKKALERLIRDLKAS